MKNIDTLTITQLLQNPTGRFSAYMARRDRIIDDMDNRYRKLLTICKKFNFKIYKVKKDYLFHFEIPSEEFPNNLLYNVCILFCVYDEVAKDKTINNYTLKLFSNSPNFMFTYTYALEQNDMIIPFLKSKCSHLALTQPPSVRNPIEVYGFEKSVYFACKYIMDNNLNHIFDIDNNRRIYNQTKFKTEVMSQEMKYEENKKIKKQISDEKKKAKQALKSKTASDMTDTKKFKSKTTTVSKTNSLKKNTTKKTGAINVIKRKKK